MSRTRPDPLQRGEKLNVRMNVRLSETLKAEFDAICRKHDLNPGSVHRRLIEQFVTQYRKGGLRQLQKVLPFLTPKDQ